MDYKDEWKKTYESIKKACELLEVDQENALCNAVVCANYILEYIKVKSSKEHYEELIKALPSEMMDTPFIGGLASYISNNEQDSEKSMTLIAMFKLKKEVDKFRMGLSNGNN